MVIFGTIFDLLDPSRSIFPDKESNDEKRHKEMMSMIGRVKEDLDKKKRYIDILEKDNQRLREENKRFSEK